MLSSALTRARKWGGIGRNPAQDASPPAPDTEETPSLDEEQIRVFLGRGPAGVRLLPSLPHGSINRLTQWRARGAALAGRESRINVQLQGAPNAPFIIAGVSPARDGVSLGMSLGAMLTDRVELSGGYDVLWSSNQTFQTYQLTVKVHF